MAACRAIHEIVPWKPPSWVVVGIDVISRHCLQRSLLLTPEMEAEDSYDNIMFVSMIDDKDAAVDQNTQL